MIHKCLSRKSGARPILTYLFKDQKKLVGDKRKPIIIRHNVRSRSLEKWVQEFAKNEKYRLHPRSNNVKVYHTVLSFNVLDKAHITEKVLRDTAKEYMKLRGMNNLYIGTAHYDKEHIHLHLVMPGTKYLTGEANRLSRAEFQQLKVAMDTWQQKRFPALVNSLPRHGRSKELIKPSKEPKTASYKGRESKKELLLNSLEKAYSKSKSIDSFLAQIKKEGHEPYYRAGKLTGVKFQGDLKFRFNRLGYDQDKLNKLEAIQQKEEKTLSELRDLRSGRNSNSRDRIKELNSRTDDKEKDQVEEPDETKNDSIEHDDIEREHLEETENDDQKFEDSGDDPDDNTN